MKVSYRTKQGVIDLLDMTLQPNQRQDVFFNPSRPEYEYTPKEYDDGWGVQESKPSSCKNGSVRKRVHHDSHAFFPNAFLLSETVYFTVTNSGDPTVHRKKPRRKCYEMRLIKGRIDRADQEGLRKIKIYTPIHNNIKDAFDVLQYAISTYHPKNDE